VLLKNQKRLILLVIDLVFSIFIWYVNASWGNTFLTCLILSTTTFLIILTPFEIYWSFRDIWFDRWNTLYLEQLISSKEKIKVDNGFLIADIIKSRDKEKIKSKNAIIIICHGFSDVKENLQYYYFPLALNGYVILAYDARGIGESKKTGKGSQFLKRIEDYKKVIDWIKSNKKFNQMKIYSVGMSIGAITVLCGGFPNKDIEKIIAISSMSNYRQNIPKYNLLVILSYLIKGVKLFPKDEENKKLSPILVFKSLKDKMTTEEWKKFSEKVLLIHCKNDKVIKFKNFEQNTQVLELSKKNQLILKKGGHSQKKNELALVGVALNFFRS